MRLIDCQTLQLEEFIGDQLPNYAILSHTWGPQEVSFSDYTSNRTAAESKYGYRKIHFACTQAYKDRIPYVWVDTCCIDKSSSTELSESINSMYKWYQNSEICYAYLSDVLHAKFNKEFPKSRWFSRGWTLQELIARTILHFYDQNWCIMGSKRELGHLISKFTRIDIRALIPNKSESKPRSAKIDLRSFCVAKRMSWASSRETTRVEDIAYCLLGIFNVNMPLLYGEGKRAFIRLQEEIIRDYSDDSILAWGLDTDTKDENGLIPETIAESMYMEGGPLSDLLAESPKYFENCQDLEHNVYPTTSFIMTNLGLEIELPLVPVPPYDLNYDPDRIGWVALLSCLAGPDVRLPGIVLSPPDGLDKTPALVQRIECGDWCRSTRKQTFLIGVRAANQATVAKITILKHKESRYIRRDLSLGYRHILVNESKALREVGYRTSFVSAQNVNDIYEYDIDYVSHWSPEEKLFTTTTQGHNFTEDLVFVCLNMCSEKINHEVSVFICDENAIVRDGSVFTESERRTIYRLLDNDSKIDADFDGLTIASAFEGSYQQYRIVVSIKKKVVVPCRCTYEVTIDAVRDARVEHEKAVRVDC